jgi:hypothetical protein
MRRAVLALLLALAPVAYGAEEANLREARALLDAMRLDNQLQAMAGAMSQGLARELGSMGDREPRVAQIFMQESMAVMRERAVQPGGMIDQAANAYAETFTVEELREIRKFYESPVGRRMLEKTPELMSRAMQGSMGRVREAFPEICQRARSRLQAEGLQSAAGAMRCEPPPAPAQGNR